MIKYRAARGIGQQATGRGANGVPIRQRNVARYRNCGGEQAFVKDAFGVPLLMQLAPMRSSIKNNAYQAFVQGKQRARSLTLIRPRYITRTFFLL